MTQTMDDTIPPPGGPADQTAAAATADATAADATTTGATTSAPESGDAPTAVGWSAPGDGGQWGGPPAGGDGPPPFGGWTPPGAGGGWQPSGGGQPRPNRLRRSREDRVAVGLAGGLGRYFAVDPVIFRVIFGVLALFGGSGIVLYLLGWAAIPDEDTVQAPVDRAIAALRRRHVPVSVVLGVGLVVVWLAFFSWWAPSSFIPAVALVIVIALFLMRGGSPIRAGDPIADPAPPRPEFTAPLSTPTAEPPPAGSELRSWFQDSRAHARIRRRRRRPVLVSAWLTLALVVGALAVTDAVHGVTFGLYFWTVGAIVLVGLVVGAVARRTPWPLLPLLVPVFIGVFVFGSSPVSAHDGWGDRAWTPAAAGGLQPNYRMAFGRGTLDFTGLAAPTAAESTYVRMGAGQVRVIVPSSVAVVVTADVHLGEVAINDVSADNGANFTDTYLSPAARAHPDLPRLAVHVRLTSGQLDLVYRQ